MMQPPPLDSPPNTLSAAVLSRLREDLKANRFEPGSKLRFEDMKEIYQVGLAPLREALMRLSEVGLVVQTGQKGFRVPPASADDLRDVIETRRFLELRVLEDSLQHGDEQWESRVVASLYRFSKFSKRAPSTPAERAEWERHHTDLHRALVSGAKSRWLLQFWSTVFDQAERYRRLAIKGGHWPSDELKRHEELVEAALERNTKKAVDLLRRHIGGSAERLMPGLQPLVSQLPTTKRRTKA